MYTAIHRALGIEPGQLTMDLVRRAVAARVAEREDLDWKQVLPKHSGPWVEEFAKDVAAMANAGGGMIIYGVIEDGSEAADIRDVGPITDIILRELRGAAFSGITPPVLGLQLLAITDADNGESVLALLIPPSDEAPHLVFRHDMFGAPVRIGTQTGWMKERMLESAYRQRFAERDRRLIGLDDLFDESAAPFREPHRAWMVAVARPEIRGRPKRIEPETAHKILSEARQNAPIAQRHLSPLDQLQPRMNNPMLGLRRWTVQSTDLDTDKIYGCRISIHFDGSVTVAMAVAGNREADTRSQVQIQQIESILTDLAATALTASRELSIVGGYAVKASIFGNGSEPVSLMEPAPGQPGFYDRAPSPVATFIPVTGMIPTDEGTDPILEGLREIALDLINQAGARQLHLLKTPIP